MKRLAITTLALLSAGAIFAQTTAIGRLAPKDARSMAMGGAFTSLATGYQSFYGNPAGFAASYGQITLTNVNAWAYVKPTQANISKVQDLFSGSSPQKMIGTLNELITDNGIGAGASLGLGYSGKGFGVGAFLINEEYASGKTLLGTSIKSQTQGSAVIGLGIPIGSKEYNLTIGGDIRPTFKLNGNWPLAKLITPLISGGDPVDSLMQMSAVTAFGFFIDAGASIKLGPLSAGLSVRDITAPLRFSSNTIAEIVSSLSSGSLPDDPNAASVGILPDITAGIAFAPKLLPGFLDSTFYFEVQDPITAFTDKESMWNLLHVGAEIRLLSFIYARGGINKGWISAGVGVDLLVLEIDAAVFTEELGKRPGDRARSGIAIQAALRI